ncbi:MAG: hypothetical protein V7L25_02875 [Nostoc sp.]
MPAKEWAEQIQNPKLIDQSNTRAIVAIAKNVAIKSKLRVAPG